MLPRSLSIPDPIVQAMIGRAQAERPLEVCGLLGGRGGEVLLHLAVPNALASKTRFRMEPHAMLAALDRLEAEGLELLAVYHSHPAGPDTLSAADLAEDRIPEAVKVLLFPQGSRWGLAAFDLPAGGVPAKCRLTVT